MSEEEHGEHKEGSEAKIYVIRRIKKVKKHGHHGGSWKIAYADFVTAMMTFFLLMWLLSLLNKYQLEGIAEYFKKPLAEALPHEGTEKGTQKNQERFTQKERYKEKPNKIDVKPDKDKEQVGVSEFANSQPSKEGKPEYKMQKSQADELQALKATLQANLEKAPEMQQYKNQLNFVITADGLKIELRDMEKNPMFSTGKADFQKYAQPIMSWLSQQLKSYPNQIMIIGHTDAVPFKSSAYTNWELSADRANATRRELVRYGMDPEKITRIVGVGEKDALDKNNKLNPVNRRIEIIVMTDRSMEKLHDNGGKELPKAAAKTSAGMQPQNPSQPQSQPQPQNGSAVSSNPK